MAWLMACLLVCVACLVRTWPLGLHVSTAHSMGAVKGPAVCRGHGTGMGIELAWELELSSSADSTQAPGGRIWVCFGSSCGVLEVCGCPGHVVLLCITSAHGMGGQRGRLTPRHVPTRAPGGPVALPEKFVYVRRQNSGPRWSQTVILGVLSMA